MIKEYIIEIDENQDKKDIHGGYPLIESPLELIRCKDCKHVGCSYVTRGFYCMKYCMDVHPDFFCADGEKRETE